MNFALHLEGAAGQPLCLLFVLPAKACCAGAKIPKKISFEFLKLQKKPLITLEAMQALQVQVNSKL